MARRFSTLPKLRAALIHLLMSVLVVGVLLLIASQSIYPSPLHDAIGAKEIVVLMVTVDIVLGPLLTFVVYNERKKSLRFDLCVIATAQLCALMYAGYVLYSARPVFIAALGHRFDLVQANELQWLGENEALEEVNIPRFRPVIVGTRAPASGDAQMKSIERAIAGLGDRGHFPETHITIDAMKTEILQNAEPLSKLKALNSGQSAEIDAWLSQRGRKDADVVFQGLKARARDMSVIIDITNGKVIGIAPFKPWD